MFNINTAGFTLLAGGPLWYNSSFVVFFDIKNQENIFKN